MLLYNISNSSLSQYTSGVSNKSERKLMSCLKERNTELHISPVKQKKISVKL